MSIGETTQIRGWIARTRQGDPAAMDELFTHFPARLFRLTRTMLGEYPSVRRREETGDVYQESALRLMTALRSVDPTSTRHFFRLAAIQIRRELIDLARQYRAGEGPSRAGGCRGTGLSGGTVMGRVCDEAEGPDRLAMWTEFHERAATLPEPLGEVFDLVWYQGMSQVEVAELLGVSERTIHTRWRKARLTLHDALEGQLPWE